MMKLALLVGGAVAGYAFARWTCAGCGGASPMPYIDPNAAQAGAGIAAGVDPKQGNPPKVG